MPALQKATISVSCRYKCYALLPQLLEACLVPDGCLCLWKKAPSELEPHCSLLCPIRDTALQYNR